MKTGIEINEQLLKEAMELSHSRTKQEAVNMALKYYVDHLKRGNMKGLFGKVTWEGDLGEMREC